MRSSGKNTGFTLVEMLLVIAIVGTLAAIILPVLGKAKTRAQGIQCVSNLKQFTVGWQIYTDESNNYYPINSSTTADHEAPVGEDLDNPSWVAGVLKTNAFTDNTNIAKLIGSTYSPFASIGGYAKNPNLYQCPGDISIDPGNFMHRVRSISMNGWINPGIMYTASTYWPMPFKKFTQPSRFVGVSPVKIFVFLDEDANSINDGWFYEDMDGYNSDGSINQAQLGIHDVPASYHNGCGSLSFADGHCELHRWQGSSANYSGSDLIWIITHATISQRNP